MRIDININIQQSDNDKILKEILHKVPSIQEVKDAVKAAADQVVSDINTAVQNETAEVVTQIQAIPVGTPITQQDLDDLVASVKGIGTAAVSAVDSISVNDGAGGTVTPTPPPPPVV